MVSRIGWGNQMEGKNKNVLQEDFKNAIINLDMEKAMNATNNALDSGITPYDLIDEMGKASAIVGEKFEANEYFISELVISGTIMKSISEILKPRMTSDKMKFKGKVIVGSAPGDMHDIGKNIVIVSLIGAGYDVVDLGIDVPPEKFVESVENEKPQIIGISALTSATMLGIKDVIEALISASIRDKVRVIVGGAPLTDEFAESVGADARAKDVVHGIRVCEDWVSS